MLTNTFFNGIYWNYIFNETNNMKKKFIKRLIINSFYSSTFHGLKNLVITDLWLVRLIWLVCLVISASFCVYFITGSVLGYLNYETVSQLNVIYEAKGQVFNRLHKL